MEKLRLGIAVTASCCCYEKLLAAAEKLAEKHELRFILSENAARTDSRFGTAAQLRQRLERISGAELITDIAGAEPIGPQAMFDALIIAPCTANTLAKLRHGICDGCVTMAAKSHLRIGRPLLIAFGSNDGLGASAPNIAELLNRKNIYFLPLYQDDPQGKPRSLAGDYGLLEEALMQALDHRQIQPILSVTR